MVGLIIGILVLAALAVAFWWLATRAWHSRHAAVKWLGVFFSGLLGLVFTAVTALALIGIFRLDVPQAQYRDAPTASIPVTGSPAQVARGQELAYLCAGCHSSTGSPPLDGSKDDFLAGGPPLGTLYPPNLTPSGPVKDWTDAQIARAIREGVDNQGRALIIMPSDAFHGMSDEDVYSLVAYLRTQPPSTRSVPLPSLNVLGHAIIGSGVFPTSVQEPITSPITAPQRAATADYGKYITDGLGCRSCHGANLAGGGTGGAPGSPPAPNLTAVVPQWNQADFITFFRTGVAPGGRQINPDNMPWKDYSKVFTDQDLQALYLFLHSLPLTNQSS